MGRFAEKTEVSVDKSRAEIEKLIVRYGATSTAFMNSADRSLVMFEAKGRRVVFELKLPSQGDHRFTHSARGARPLHVAYAAWEQGCRQSWRALALVIKAKLEAVEAGITTFEQEFYAHIMLPEGRTIYDATKEKVAMAYTSGRMVALLPDYSAKEARAKDDP